MGSDFWDKLVKGSSPGEARTAGMDMLLQNQGMGEDYFSSVQQLTDVGRSKAALELPVPAGTRVEFKGSLGSVMAYEDPPRPGSQGTVVSARSSTGDITDHDGMVFVRWDDGKTRAIHAEYLRLAQGRRKHQASNAIRVASLGDLTDFLRVAENTLVHKSTRDLWSVKKEGDEYIIERLFDDNGEPLKV